MTLSDAILPCLAALAAAHVVAIAALLLSTFVRRNTKPSQRPAISILRPACGIENNVEETLASAYRLNYPEYEIVFCVADSSDPVVPVIERLIKTHPGVPSRLLIGDDVISNNPKLNNLVKGWRAARHEWIVMTDSNVLMPADYLDRLIERMQDGVGLVSSAPTGIRADGSAAELECAFLNTYQARWQLTADAFGNGYAQGKTLFWRRRDLDNAGGIRALATSTAEDIASSLLMRSLGLKVRLVNGLSPQPLGQRSFKQVWKRQVRWAQLRRKDLPSIFWFEPLSFNALLFALTAIAFATGSIGAIAALGVVVACYAVEYLLAKSMSWPVSPLSLPSWIARDLLLPLVWLRGALANHYEWRGNSVAIKSMEWKAPDVSSRAESMADG